MKIQERTGAGAGRAAAPAQPSVGDRLPSPPRERKPALAALAVLLILLGALGATMLVLQVGDRVEAIQVTEDIKPGASITKDNIKVVMVNDDSGANFVPWEQRASLMKLQAKSTVYAGTVVVGEMFAGKVQMPEGKASVGLALKEGQYYADIKGGDTVAAYRVGTSGSSSSDSSDKDSSSSSSGNGLIATASVQNVKGESDATVSTGSKSITLLVDEGDAAALASASSAGEVALVRVPAK
ncbi:hypothetical protein OHA99_15520 [Streptomyces coelicoflavus]|uniref:hypothetical protein n=1 Tax=Streptomyces TaxID=1883 RepID=UPI0012908E3F|nr:MULTISPECIES: hypothetical protein [Streptomyces]MCX5036098.1 hypothetical protein [Streptomyces coelicoflavus]QFX82349.1 hypothetical protein GEV49_16465 [Streptomyces sp. SYP-A7193]